MQLTLDIKNQIRRNLWEIKSYIQESALHIKRLTQQQEKGRLIILPNGPLSSSGSNMLWGWELATELKHLGWRVTVVPPHFSLLQRCRIIEMDKADAILMIKGRHQLNYPELYEKTPCVFILDDADYVQPDQLDQVISCCKTSKAIIAGNDVVADWCKQYNKNVSVVWVSHPIPNQRASTLNSQRSSIIAWAHANPWYYPMEAKFVQNVVLELAKRKNFEFWLYGVNSQQKGDEYLEPIRRAGISTRIFSFIPSYQKYLKTLERVAIGLHPVCLENPYSQGKSFGKILSYIAADVAVVTHNVLDHKKFFRHNQNGMLPNNVKEYVECLEQLLSNRSLRQQIVNNCYEDFLNQLSTPVAARQVDNILSSVCG